MTVFLGIDLAWGVGSATKLANETGLVALQPDGRILDAGWARGVDATLEWISQFGGAAVMAVDAPLLVENETGQRICERDVGRRYGRWKVSANSSNTGSKHLAGVDFRRALEAKGWEYDDGHATGSRTFFECYPYTTLVGVEELGYDVQRPTYKRKPKAVPTAEWRAIRAASCDDLIRRLFTRATDPPLDLRSHPTTAELADVGSPLSDVAYKHREDLLDAVICAWTASFWFRHGRTRCQVLGDGDAPLGAKAGTIIAPMRQSQGAAQESP